MGWGMGMRWEGGWDGMGWNGEGEGEGEGEGVGFSDGGIWETGVREGIGIGEGWDGKWGGMIRGKWGIGVWMMWRDD